MCVCVCVCRCGARGVQYYDYNFLGFNLYIIVDLVKDGVLTLVSEIQHCGNDCDYYYASLHQGRKRGSTTCPS